MKAIVILAMFLIGLLTVTLFVGRWESRKTSDRISQKPSQIAPHYMEYTEATIAQAQHSGRTVLFFWAPWCSTCSVLNDDLQKRSGELPGDVTILKVNFDTEKDLKQKYFIVQQHTLVWIDKDGKEIKKWVGGNVDLLRQKLEES